MISEQKPFSGTALVSWVVSKLPGHHLGTALLECDESYRSFSFPAPIMMCNFKYNIKDENWVNSCIG